jgi:hypothetical protein
MIHKLLGINGETSVFGVQPCETFVNSILILSYIYFTYQGYKTPGFRDLQKYITGKIIQHSTAVFTSLYQQLSSVHEHQKAFEHFKYEIFRDLKKQYPEQKNNIGIVENLTNFAFAIYNPFTLRRFSRFVIKQTLNSLKIPYMFGKNKHKQLIRKICADVLKYKNDYNAQEAAQAEEEDYDAAKFAQALEEAKKNN